MDLVKDYIKRLYRKYLSASIMSAVVMSIYSIADSVAIGQSEGPAGSAALAVITPLYGIYAFLSILCGVGGSVLYSNAKGEEKHEKANAYFTTATAMMVVLVLLTWGGFALFHNPVLMFFGADAELLPKVMEYAWWIIGFMPMFLLSMFISAFVFLGKYLSVRLIQVYQFGPCHSYHRCFLLLYHQAVVMSNIFC